ncbi:rho family-interacting cell polarization regulator 1 [Nothobranchius furzeri]|uniref:Protein FAM65A-like n=1 Tax=Nothobranchius furzeri TaxID=105023 RepID=A0A9D2Y6H0_NOTFU|nr:protein FAM65A-like [Nothobranchius furzeri]
MPSRSAVAPKVPQPERVDQVYEALKKGLESYLHVHRTDLDNLNREIQESKRNSRLGFLYEFDQQVKVIENNIRSLEVHLNKVKGIYEGYCQQRRLRDEATKLMKENKSASGGKETKERFVKANKDYKEYSERMCALENTLQSQLGQFNIKMKGLAGFARLCAGDQYEILMKYGRQRWKLHGSIEANNNQVWDNGKVAVFPFIGEFLCVKVTELKSLAHHVVVGNIVCETKDLFAPLPQKVAVDVNDPGTIKMVLEVTWYPVPKDSSGSFTDVENSQISTLALSSSPTLPQNENHSLDTPIDDDLYEVPDLDLPPPLPEKKRHRPQKESVYEQADPPVGAAGYAFNPPSEYGESGLVDSDLEDTLEILISALEEYKQFCDLQKLEHELRLLQSSLKGCSHRQSRSMDSADSSVERALSSFDFLGASDGVNNRTSCTRPTNGRPHLTTGCTTLDCCLLVHLNNCGAQLMHLGVSGPLRCKETYAIDKLLREARVLKTICLITEDDPRRPRQPTEVIPELAQCHGAESLWKQCVGHDSVYAVSADSFLTTLSTVYSSVLSERTNPVVLCLAERILEQRLSQQDDTDGLMMTIFQLWNYLGSNGISDMETHLIEVAEEVWLLQNLSSGDEDVVLSVLHSPTECSLKREGVQAVANLLDDPRVKVSAAASSVLRILAAEPRQRDQVLVHCMEMLEDDNVEVRVCGCKALGYLMATESIDQLVYLCQMDKQEVQQAATETLLKLGEEGVMALRDTEMSQEQSADALPEDYWRV